jgi:hypothetical protein
MSADLYAGRYATPEAIAAHRARSLATAHQMRAEGRCVACGQPHETPGRVAGTRAHRCETCRVSARERARAAYHAQKGGA